MNSEGMGFYLRVGLYSWIAIIGNFGKIECRVRNNLRFEMNIWPHQNTVSKKKYEKLNNITKCHN